MSEDVMYYKEDNGEEGRYAARFADIPEEGEITYTHVAPGVISANHTGVPRARRGQGYAEVLLNHMLQDARENDFKIVPVCPFIAAEYARHPEWSDLFTIQPGERL
ncbi:MAG: GNAT family N-acetyltransferase [Paracoccus sp. (in: a-proteobacteria)]